MSGPSSSAGRAARDVREKSTDTLQAVKQLGSDAKQVAQDQVQRVTEAAQDQLENLRDTAGEYYEQGRAKAEELCGSLEQRIQRTPLQSVMIAAGVGFVLGMIITRR